MSLLEAVKSAFKNYANFNGRARRSEYWYFFLFNDIVFIAAAVLGGLIGAAADELTGAGLIIVSLYSLVVILPGLAVNCRRLHDVGKSGAYIFFALIPVVGAILLWVWAFEDGQPWTNQYGPDPKGRNMSPFGGYYAAGAPAPTPAPSTAAKTNKICPNCGATIDSDSVFCSFCGKDTRMTAKTHAEYTPKETYHPAKTCVNCGAIVETGARFCPNCGKDPNKAPVTSQSGSRPKGFSAPTDLD